MSYYFLFVVEDGQAVPGCVERMVISSPFFAPHPQTGKMTPSVKQTAAWIQQNLMQQYPFPPNGNFKGHRLGPAEAANNKADLICIQMTPPSLDPRYVNSGQPTGDPRGNGGMDPPPQPGPPGAREPGVNYEEIDDAGLSTTSDTMMGDGDPFGGTYTDIDGQGRETPRNMNQPPSTGPHGR